MGSLGSGQRDVTKEFIVRLALRGFRRGVLVRDSRRPVSFPLLVRLLGGLSSVCFSDFECRLFRVAFSFAFFGALRVGELVSGSRYSGGGLQALDVVLEVESVRFLVRRSKTDQDGRGFSVSLFGNPGCLSCPVSAAREFLLVHPSVGGSFLVHADGTALSRFQFISVFRKSLEVLGFRASEYCSHSFRIGAATQAARWGLGEEVIRRIGRWESVRFRSYVRPGLVELH
ncbi:uncharacterized protein WCC33_002809 [Rhinophrynus dorsalis]